MAASACAAQPLHQVGCLNIHHIQLQVKTRRFDADRPLDVRASVWVCMESGGRQGDGSCVVVDPNLA